MKHHEPSGMYYNWYDEATGDGAHHLARRRRPRLPVPLQRRQRLARRRPAWSCVTADRGAAPLADRLFGRMRWDMFYDTDTAHPGCARRPDPRRLLRRAAAARDLRRYTGNHIGVGPGRLVHQPPLRHHGVRDPHHELPRHPHRADPGQAVLRHVAHLPGDLRLVLAGDAAGRRRTAPTSGVDVYEGAYTYRGMHIVPGWGGSMFEELMPDVFVPEASWAPRSWGLNHPLHVRAQREHGLIEAGYGYWGFSPVERPVRAATASTASTRSG